MTYQQDELTKIIIQCIIKVHSILGPGFLESIYRKALLIELRAHNACVETEVEVLVFYNGEKVGYHRLDLLVDKRVIVELKTVESLSSAHYAQVRSYMKATNVPVAILVNFSREKADFRRIEATKT